MVDYIFGDRLEISKCIVKAAMDKAKKSTGQIVFLDGSNLEKEFKNSSIQIINPKKYNINRAMQLLGFLLGICAANKNVTDIYIDSVFADLELSNTEPKDFMELINTTSNEINVNFHFALFDSFDSNLNFQAID